jgi:hypothetical protein
MPGICVAFVAGRAVWRPKVLLYKGKIRGADQKRRRRSSAERYSLPAPLNGPTTGVAVQLAPLPLSFSG